MVGGVPSKIKRIRMYFSLVDRNSQVFIAPFGQIDKYTCFVFGMLLVISGCFISETFGAKRCIITKQFETTHTVK